MLRIASQEASVGGASKIRMSYLAVRLMALSSNGGISGSESMPGTSNESDTRLVQLLYEFRYESLGNSNHNLFRF